MKILCIGDVFSSTGRSMMHEHLEGIKRYFAVDVTIINGENLAHGRGMSRQAYEEMCSLGVDGFTMGNHTWDCKDITNLLKYNKNIIRPANFSRSCPGNGSMLLKTASGEKVGVINLVGRTYMNPCDCPFEAAEREIKRLKAETDIIVVDFHAEATSEKQAMGWFLDGKVSCVFGTHTHVQTADEAVLPGGTGYITDLGMTGAYYSVLGMERKPVIEKFISGIPQRMDVATGKGRLCGCVFDVDSKGASRSAERICIM